MIKTYFFEGPSMLMNGWSKRTTLITLIALFITLSGCSDDQSPNNEIVCNAGERINPITSLCEPVRSDNTPPDEDAGTHVDALQPADTDPIPQQEDASLQDSSTDTTPPEQDSQPTDIDNREITCLDIAEGYVDPDVVCEFYAHTVKNLYLVDPFRKTLKEVMSLPGNAYDIDMHTDGTLYLIADNVLSSLDAGATAWQKIGDVEVGNPNGLCLDMSGTAFITSYSDLYSFDLVNNRRAGPIGGKDKLKPYSSSGDCVINKGDVLYMSSSKSGSKDDLVEINSSTGETIKIGSIGFSGVYALTAAWGRLFGLTGTGELIEINSTTGRGTLIHTFPGKAWNGAASTPQR